MIDHYDQVTLPGVEGAPPRRWFDPEDRQNILAGVDDIYTDHITNRSNEDYEPGDEMRYFPEIVEAALRAYEISEGVTIDSETVRFIHEEIRIGQLAVEVHGFEENIFEV